MAEREPAREELSPDLIIEVCNNAFDRAVLKEMEEDELIVREVGGHEYVRLAPERGPYRFTIFREKSEILEEIPPGELIERTCYWIERKSEPDYPERSDWLMARPYEPHRFYEANEKWKLLGPISEVRSRGIARQILNSEPE